LPSYTEFTALFDMFRISRIDCSWVPEYTELTDASTLSNAVNVRFYSAVDQTDSSAPLAVNDVLQYQNCIQTSITREHKRSLHPTIMVSSLLPVSSWIPSASPSTKWYGLKVAVSPCGVAMTFRSVVTVHLECANVN
jgi:hypothetical protein